MASACVNNMPTTYSNYGWLSPIISQSSPSDNKSDLKSSVIDAGDFEFRLGDNVTMLPADELFSDGKLVPLQFPIPPPSSSPPEDEVRSPELEKPCRRSTSEDPYLISPKAPRCSSRWRELLGLKKLQLNNREGHPKTTSTTSSKSIRHFLNRNLKTASSLTTTPDTSVSLPLLKDSSSSSSSMEYESISITSSRLSLSSTSSDHDHDELPRPSLDAEKPKNQPIRSVSSGPKLRSVRPRENPRVGRSPMRNETMTTTRKTVTRGVSVDSPRMNPSGRVVFQSLERSSSSPSSFNGGPKHYNNNNRGVMERSYSGNVHVRITPVLNVPVVCSLRGSSKSGVFGFGQLFSSSSSSHQSQKKEGNINNNNYGSHINSRSFQQKKEGNNNKNGSINTSRNKREKEKESS